MEDSSELSRFDSSVTALGVGVDSFLRRKSIDVNSIPGVPASELDRLDLEEDLPLVKVKRRLILLFVSVFSALFTSTGLLELENGICLHSESNRIRSTDKM